MRFLNSPLLNRPALPLLYHLLAERGFWRRHFTTSPLSQPGRQGPRRPQGLRGARPFATGAFAPGPVGALKRDRGVERGKCGFAFTPFGSRGLFGAFCPPATWGHPDGARAVGPVTPERGSPNGANKNPSAFSFYRPPVRGFPIPLLAVRRVGPVFSALGLFFF